MNTINVDNFLEGNGPDSVSGGELLITFYVKKLDFVRMSVVLDDGDNPLPLVSQGFEFPLVPTFI